MINKFRFNLQRFTLNSVVRGNATTALSAERSSFSVTTDSWAENTEETSEYIHYADIVVDHVTPENYVEVLFDKECQDIVSSAEICCVGEVLNDKVRLFAKKEPESTISGECIVFKGVS